MIWFACKQCGKRHGRPENLAGTLVFCECGQGNRVPWASTAPEPEPQEAQPASPPRPRTPAPYPEDERPPAYPSPPLRRPREVRRPNPAFCLNHDETASEHTCVACRARFCSACVVTLQGQTLCGPCKNFRIRGLGRPARMAPLALVALIVALVAGPVSFFLTMMAIGLQATPEGSVAGAVVVSLFAAALPAGTLVLGGFALRQIETTPQTGGRSLAMTGATTSLVGMLWSLTIAVLIVYKQFQ
jgi:hypothetical protein